MAGGAPRKWKSVKAMQEAIDAYFKECEGEPFIGDDGRAERDKYGMPIIINAKPPTITGIGAWIHRKTSTAGLSSKARVCGHGYARKVQMRRICRISALRQRRCERREILAWLQFRLEFREQKERRPCGVGSFAYCVKGREQCKLKRYPQSSAK